jgi:hypothetical protein
VTGLSMSRFDALPLATDCLMRVVIAEACWAAI